ncbi:MAG: hypothetical protein WDW36_004871 [Sanguina aurantia]
MFSRGRLATLATCNLNQWAMDYEGNLRRIVASIRDAKAQGATYRVGPELEVCGYGCEDHFLELDTVEHCWEALAEILSGDVTDGIVCDIGMPVIHRGVLYNCRVLVLDRKILLIRPKLFMANDGNYRETRYFGSWKHRGSCEQHHLPAAVRLVTHQSDVQFGDAVLRFDDALLAAETCEELFTPRSPHIDLALGGVEIISNGSGSHHQLRKLDTRLDLIRGATAKAGGVYLYANQRGCDGGRLYYDGCACVALNGQLLAQGSQFSLREVEVVVATVDLDEVVSYRGAISSLREQASCTPPPTLIPVNTCLARAQCSPTISIRARIWAPEEEIAYGPACWLWDYLRRSGASGFLLPLSGGADSSSTAAIVGAMCQMAVQAVSQGDAGVEADARRIGQYTDSEAVAGAPNPARSHPTSVPATKPIAATISTIDRHALGSFLQADLPEIRETGGVLAQVAQALSAVAHGGPSDGSADAAAADESPGATAAVASASDNTEATAAALSAAAAELARRIFVTVYMGTVNSSRETQDRSALLARQVGSYHYSVAIDSVVEALVALFQGMTGKRPLFRAHGGSTSENLALQNIQARLRMVLAFLIAQLSPWVRGRAGFLLVLGSANVDEALRGYLTKYDCSSADINPIGGISKTDLRRFLLWGSVHLGYPVLAQVESAPPTAELEPLEPGKKPQNDEDDMGMSYADLSVYGRLRKISRCGPVTMFRRCMELWRVNGVGLSPLQVAAKVKMFFRYYAINRHKATVLTPSYHAESYSPDDNRYDHRPFLYNSAWPWQFKRIDQAAAAATAAAAKPHTAART